MAYAIGTAANHDDLLERLVTFLSTALGPAENWEVLRYTGVTDIAASSFVVNWEPWTAFRGPYHTHANGWATAVGQHANCWLGWTLVRPLDLARLKLVGSATANQSPRDFALQWSDDGLTWTDRKAFAGITWASNETKEFAIDGLSPGPKSHWRIFVSANGGNTSSTVIVQVLLPEWQIYQDFNHARRPAAWLKAPGLTGFDPCYVNFQIYDRPTNDYYNLALTGCTGFVGAAQFDDQPGALTALAIPLWSQPIAYWLAGNGQRVILSVKIDTAYLSAYAGKMLPFGTPQQYPYPLLIGAPLPAASATRYSDSSVVLPYKGNRTTLKLRKNDGSWIQPLAWPYSKTTTFRDTAGAYPLLPVTLYDTANTYGVLDGVHFITGFGNAVENTVTIGAETHVVLQDVTRNGLGDFFTMRIG